MSMADDIPALPNLSIRRMPQLMSSKILAEENRARVARHRCLPSKSTAHAMALGRAQDLEQIRVVTIDHVAYFPPFFTAMKFEFEPRPLTEIAKVDGDGRFITFHHRRTYLEVCNLRVLRVVKRIKVEITNLSFRCLGDGFPDQISQLLIEEFVDVRLSSGFKDAASSIVVYSV